jgi:hypothetical protein
MHLKPCSLGEAYLEVSLPGWCALLNCNLVLNCAGLPRRFSSQNCKIESVCLIGLAKRFHLWPSEQDAILLDIHNWDEESCIWNLIATTSHNLTIMSLPRCQISIDTSITMVVPSPTFATSNDWCLLLWPSALLEPWLPLILILVISQVTSNSYPSSILPSRGCQC